MLFVTDIDTPIGRLTAGASEEGILFLEFGDNKKPSYTERIFRNLQDIGFKEADNNHLINLRRELEEYFDGKRKEFSVQVVMQGTEFQKVIWLALVKIPFGSAVSYLELAESLGNTGSVRAVANANAKNPVAIVIPCHRVIGENGKLTGYAGGLWRKKWLIDHESKYSGKPFPLQLF